MGLFPMEMERKALALLKEEKENEEMIQKLFSGMPVASNRFNRHLCALVIIYSRHDHTRAPARKFSCGNGDRNIHTSLTPSFNHMDKS